MGHQLIITYLAFIGFILLLVPFSINTLVEVRIGDQNYSENATQIYGTTIFGGDITYQQLEPPKYQGDWGDVIAMFDYGIQYIGYLFTILFVTSTMSWFNILIIIPMSAGLIWALVKLLKPDWL
jgi:hypothetical protein